MDSYGILIADANILESSVADAIKFNIFIFFKYFIFKDLI